ncbi:heme-binding protein [Rhizobium ruizarguesonis]|uniref:heme-binding protein n=1 Tax=Rhizobium ruizarguesonis TaxID=2081791 RepID=UPI0013BBEF98|nr:heme-binding protein [Rhizobium ruizarguesonis]NEH33045.1 hypothetical protein [Rhizobium ruizarguesonis]NEJ10689.1 hypothetical protein [Rhizobium ruizarguesonis]NEK12895.1 hypothetical protein [Rhizobium ruizarguesonis]
MEMNLTAARKMITVAQSRAAEIGVRATIVVLDHGGDPVATSDDADDSSDDASDDRSDDAMTTAESSRRDDEKRSPEFRRTKCASLATSAVGCLPCCSGDTCQNQSRQRQIIRSPAPVCNPRPSFAISS